MTYIVGYDGSGQTGKAYGVKGIPHAFLIDSDGAIAWKGHPMALQDEAIDQVVN